MVGTSINPSKSIIIDKTLQVLFSLIHIEDALLELNLKEE